MRYRPKRLTEKLTVRGYMSISVFYLILIRSQGIEIRRANGDPNEDTQRKKEYQLKHFKEKEATGPETSGKFTMINSDFQSFPFQDLTT